MFTQRHATEEATIDDALRRKAPTLLFVVNVAWFFLSHRLPIAQAAMAAGMRVHLASDVESETEGDEVTRHGIGFHRIRMSRSGLHPAGELATAIGLVKAIRSLRPDIVHNVTAKPVVYGSLAAHGFANCAVVNAISGFGYAYGAGRRRQILRELLKLVYRRAFSGERTRVIVQNQQDARDVLRVRPDAAPRLRIIPGSGVDLSAFHPSPEPLGAPVVLLPARILREKGIIEFGEAARRLLELGIQARFLIAGRLDPGNRSALTVSEIRELCARTGVEWIGEHQNMPECLSLANVVCLPSFYREGVPKVLLEACAAQRAIVTTDISGCRDCVQDGVNGLLVPARDPSALMQAIHRLIADPILRARMASAGRARAEREFGIESVVRRHLEIYQELLDIREH